MQIGNNTINISDLTVDYADGIASIFVPYSQDIQGDQLSISTNFNPTEYQSPNIHLSEQLIGNNAALLFTSNAAVYQNAATFGFSMSIFVCIAAVFSFYKHKMMGLELILPFQVIFYSQAFYDQPSVSETIYTAFKPVSFSVLTPNSMGSQNNAWFKIGMTGGFLENYNLLGLLFVISTIALLIVIVNMQQTEIIRFKSKKSLKDWVKFAQFRVTIEKYETVIWKCFFPAFALSTIPLIFAVLSAAKTQLSNTQLPGIFTIASQRLTFLFIILFLFALFYTSIPRIFYNSKKNFLKMHIFNREGLKFRYEPNYCVYFQLHYLIIGCIFGYCQPTLPILYVLSSVNGLLFLYLIVKRPYEDLLDNIGGITSNFIVVYFLSMNLIMKLCGNSSFAVNISNYSGFLIINLLAVECVVALFRFYVFYKREIADE